jgi:hypothetical protein
LRSEETFVQKAFVYAVLVASVGLLPMATFARGGGGHGGSHTSSSHSGGSHSIRGYTTKSGNYVAPHHATNPDSSKTNNWSHKGNVNPYTGKVGTKKD